MKLQRNGSQPTVPQPATAVTGRARRDGDFAAIAPGRISGATVTFEPGARTAWHTHPLGQILLITQGSGWVQVLGGPKQTVHAGDIVTIAPGEKHWHGATATTAMAHLAIVEAVDGTTTDWMEQVSEADYLA